MGVINSLLMTRTARVPFETLQKGDRRRQLCIELRHMQFLNSFLSEVAGPIPSDLTQG